MGEVGRVRRGGLSGVGWVGAGWVGLRWDGDAGWESRAGHLVAQVYADEPQRGKPAHGCLGRGDCWHFLHAPRSTPISHQTQNVAAPPPRSPRMLKRAFGGTRGVGHSHTPASGSLCARSSPGVKVDRRLHKEQEDILPIQWQYVQLAAHLRRHVKVDNHVWLPHEVRHVAARKAVRDGSDQGVSSKW